MLAGISVFAAYFSILSYIGTPGEYVQFGPMLTLSTILSLPLVYLVVGWLIIPVVMRLPITSAFELLEARLGLSVRQAGSFSYIISRIVWMGLILYTGASMLVHVLDCDRHWSYLIVVVIGAVTTAYTLLGGIRTVMVTEAVQFCMLMLGAVLTILLITVNLGGVRAWFPHHWEPHWQAQPFFSFDPHVRVSILGAFIAFAVAGICYTVTDQSSVQRLLTTRDAETARRAYLLSSLTIAGMNLLLSLVGAALLVFYRFHPEVVPDHLTFAENGDAFFPLYISHQLPHGISGLVIASLLAAAMACLSGGLNATTTAITKDFVEIYARKDRTEAAKMRTTRLLVLILGVVSILTSIWMGSVSGNLNEVALKTVNLLLCPTFGLFFLAIFVKYSTPFGAIRHGPARFTATTAAVVLGYWDVFTGLPRFSFIWIFPIPFAVSLVCGCLLSLLPTRGRSAPVLGAYAVSTLLPLIVAVALLLGHYHRP